MKADPRPAPSVPWVTLILVVANIVGAFMLLRNPEWSIQYGFYAHEPSVLAAFRSMFLHFNILHLLGNMVFLATVGPAVERGAGPLKFAIIYLSGGLVGAFAHALFLRGGDHLPPLLGASGAIAACVGYAGVRYFSTKVEFVPRVKLSIGTLVGVWAALQILGALVRLGEPPEMGGVAFWAHIGGFLTGLLLSILFRAPLVSSVETSRATLDAMDERSPAAALAAADSHLQRHPNDSAALIRKARAQERLGDRNQESATWLASLDLLSESEQVEALSRLSILGGLEKIDSNLRLRLADRHKKKSPELAQALLTSIIEGDAKNQHRPDALFALASMLSETPSQAEPLTAVLLREYPMHPATDMARARGLLP